MSTESVDEALAEMPTSLLLRHEQDTTCQMAPQEFFASSN